MDNDALPRPAGLPRRLGAMLYDALLVLAIWLLTLLALVIAHGGDVATGPVVQTVLFLEMYAFFVFFWMRRGQTVGMVAWRLHVESVDGRPLTLTQATLRFFGALAAILSLGIGYLWKFLEPGGRTWPDLLSNTQIIYTPKVDS
jgi:uncharacterized RDD family membrane protein YckC